MTIALLREHRRYVEGPHAQWAWEHLLQRGVTFDAMEAAGIPGGGSFVEGGPAQVILPVTMGWRADGEDESVNPMICDLVSFDPAQPSRWRLRRNEYGMALGGDLLARCGPTSWQEPEIKLYASPLSWLLAGCNGAVLLNGKECRSQLLGIPRVICETVDLAETVDAMLKSGDHAWPSIMVAA